MMCMCDVCARVCEHARMHTHAFVHRTPSAMISKTDETIPSRDDGGTDDCIVNGRATVFITA